MGDWYPSERELKRYPHFDKFLPPDEIVAIVKNPERVRTNAFYPFLRYIKSWQPFRSNDVPHKKKERPIRYASRRDAYIFAYYRYLLSERYEALLKDLDLSESMGASVNSVDSDTLAAITGSIAEATFGVPSGIAEEAISRLDEPLAAILLRFCEKYVSAQ